MHLEVLAAVGVFIGGLSFGFAGFALALFATSALSLVSAPQIVVPAVMLVSDTLSLPLLWSHRRYLDRSELKALPPFTPTSLALLIVGVVIGATLLAYIPVAIGRLALAVVIFFFVAVRLRRNLMLPGDPLPLRWWRRPSSTSLAGGVLDGWLGTGGIFVVMFLTSRRVAAGLFVAAILGFFLVSDLIRAITYATLGYWVPSVFQLYAQTLPLAFAGYVSGVLLRQFFHSERAFRLAVLLLLVAYGFALIARSI